MKVVSVLYENNDVRGYCDTCDYGATTIRDISIKYEDGSSWNFHMDVEGSEWDITESDWMVILANASSVEDIITAVKAKLHYLLSQDWLEKDIWYEYNGVKTYLTNDEGDK